MIKSVSIFEVSSVWASLRSTTGQLVASVQIAAAYGYNLMDEVVLSHRLRLNYFKLLDLVDRV